MPIDSTPARVLERARQHPDLPAYHVRTGPDAWQATSWRTYAEEVRAAARALMACGVAHGQRICILGKNRPEWLILDVAAMMVGAVPAGIYTTCSPEEVAYIVGHAEAPLVLVEDTDQLAKIQATRGELPALRHVVLMRGATSDDDLAMDWDAFLAKADETPDADVDERMDAMSADDTATLIYTSGTTGPPKAVMLTHDNLTFTASTACDMVDLAKDDRMISYLPLSHIAEQMFTVHAPATTGTRIFFAESLETLLRDMQETRPTVLFGVPRVWEKMHAALSTKLGEATGIKAAIASWAMGVGREVNALRNRGQEPSGWLALKYGFAKSRVFDAVKGRLGLDTARFGITGAAPISADILEFFSGLDIVIHEVYGQSEDCGPTTFNLPGHTKFGTVGPAIPNTEVRIADDGEILVRGRHVFKGYLKNPEATDETLVDGWLHSGDLGALDRDGFLTITGRKKEIIITAGGKNIAPKNIESALKDLPLVSQAVVIGDRRKFLSALLTLDAEAATAWAESHGTDVASLPDDPALNAELKQAIEAEVNSRFARVEHVRKFTVLPGDFSPEGGELTPTLKVKRRIVDEKYATAIEAMYADA